MDWQVAAVAALYVIGFALMAGGAVVAWRDARSRLRKLEGADQRIRTAYGKMASEVGGLGYYREGDAVDHSAKLSEANAAFDRAKADALQDVSITAQGNQLEDSAVPSELVSELMLFRVASASLRGAGLAALIGGLLSTVASVWSLFL